MMSPGSLKHVPRRGVAAAKELRRMGLDVVSAPKDEEQIMSNDVKQVADVAREIADVGRRARAVADELRGNLAAVGEALEIAEGVSKALRDAGAELRGVLGAQTNNPPSESPVGGDAGGTVGGPHGGGGTTG